MNSEGDFVGSEGDFVPLPTVVTRLAARSSLPPPRTDCAGKARARTSSYLRWAPVSSSFNGLPR
jgi:hypothetical protein